jgi:hypothetical protein
MAKKKRKSHLVAKTQENAQQIQQERASKNQGGLRRFAVWITGAAMSPFVAFLLYRGAVALQHMRDHPDSIANSAGNSSDQESRKAGLLHLEFAWRRDSSGKTHEKIIHKLEEWVKDHSPDDQALLFQPILGMKGHLEDLLQKSEEQSRRYLGLRERLQAVEKRHRDIKAICLKPAVTPAAKSLPSVSQRDQLALLEIIAGVRKPSEETMRILENCLKDRSPKNQGLVSRAIVRHKRDLEDLINTSEKQSKRYQNLLERLQALNKKRLEKMMRNRPPVVSRDK